MNSPKLLFIFSFLGVLSLYSCNDSERNIDAELLPYFDRFAEEAAARGVTFDYEEEEFEGYIRDLETLVDDGVLGFCQRPRAREPFPTIYVDDDYWQASDDLRKEYVVFHELGHCFLNRDHQVPLQVDGDGNCLSIMAAGNADCSGLDTYTPERRTALLDELFK